MPHETDYEVGYSLGNSLGHCRSLVTAVGVDALDEREAAAGPPLHRSGAVSVLNIGGMNDHAQEEAKGIDEDVALAFLPAS